MAYATGSVNPLTPNTPMSEAQEVLDTAVANQPKKRGCWRGCLILFLIFALLFWWFCIHSAPLRFSEETVYVLQPMTDKGYIDYLKALEERYYPPEMKTDNNGYRLFVRQFGLVDSYVPAEDREFYRVQTYEKLGLDPGIPTTFVFPDLPVKVFKDFYEARGEEIPEHFFTNPSFYGREKRDVSEDHWQRPWTLEEFPMLANWIKDIDAPLDAIAEAVSKPVFFPPLLHTLESVQSETPKDLLGTRLPHVQTLRTAAKMFQARAMYRIARGDIDGALDDKLTLYRLGRHISPNSFIVQHLVGIALESAAATIPIGGNSEHQPTREQVQRVLDGLDALPPRASSHDAYEFERFVGLSVLQEIRHGRSLYDYTYLGEGERKIDPYEMMLRAYIASCDWNVVYRRVREMYDALQTMPPQAFETMIKEMEFQVRRDLFLQVFTARSRGTTFAKMFTALFMPAVSAYHDAAQRSECAENIQRLTLALLLYEKEHGTLPGGDWVKAITPYLGEHGERYFSCPSNPSPPGETTYRLVQHSEGVPMEPDAILLVEQISPVPFNKAVIPIEDVLPLGEWHQRQPLPHGQRTNVSRRSGAVRFLAVNMP